MSTSPQQQASGILARYRLAAAQRRRWDSILADAYRLTLPEFESHAEAGAKRGPADPKRGEEVRTTLFDSTGAEALDDKAARTHGQLFPPFERWMDLQLPAGLGDDEAVGARREAVLERFHQAIEVSNFHTEIAPSLREAYVSTGCINVNFGTVENPLSFEAVPVARIALEEARDGVPRTIFLTLPVRLRDLMLRYPKARLPDAVRRRIDDTPDETVEVMEANIWEYPADGTARGHIHWTVWLLQGETMILEDRLTAERTIAFRVDKAPGEVMGRGPVLKALPEIKTANKIVELVLKNASIAVTGIWQAEDDGVLNPANIRLVPGAIIPKAAGSSGLTPLEAPGRFDISQLLLNDLQARIRTAIKGPELPPMDEAPRTAFELSARRADHRAVEAPRTLRLLNELYDRLVRRCLYILSHHSMAGSPYYIAPAGLGEAAMLTPTSPVVRLQQEMNATSGLAGLADLAGLIGPDALAGTVDFDATARWWLRKAGLPDGLLRPRAAGPLADSDGGAADDPA